MCTSGNFDRRRQHLPRIFYPPLSDSDCQLALGHGNRNQDRGRCTRCRQHRKPEVTPGQAMDGCTVPKAHSPIEGHGIYLHYPVARRQDEVETRVLYRALN